MRHSISALLFSIVLFSSCSNKTSEEKSESLAEEMPIQKASFGLLEQDQTGISFQNTITESNEENIILYDYLYNGGGLGVGDFNRDGLQDVYFAGNQVSDELYFNDGDLHFSLQNDRVDAKMDGAWTSGVAVVDINGDGWDDIYLSRTGPGNDLERRRNVLLINKEGERFVDEAKKYGLDHTGHTTQSVFFDYDRDGDLDVYLMSHPGNFAHSLDLTKLTELIAQGALENDVLLRNDKGSFVDVSREAGLIEDHAFGLGIVCEDFNQDSWPDLYVSNDFDEGDLLYINNRNGGFELAADRLLKHTSNFGMGCDAADFNNDAWPDIITVDMAFEEHERSKRNMASMNPRKFEVRKKLGWHHQYMQNCLHLNRDGKVFSEIAQMSGVAKSDWSWSALFCDFNNDAQKDLFISNGYKRDTRDQDLRRKIAALQEKEEIPSIQDVLSVFPSTLIANKLFMNQGNLLFSDDGDEMGLNKAMHSHGAVYADFDNDGDLDLVVNNVDSKAVVFENLLPSSQQWIQLELNDHSMNGAKCFVYEGEEMQVQRLERVRGYASSVSAVLHFGLIRPQNPDSVLIELINGECFALDGLERGEKTEVDLSSARKTKRTSPSTKPLFVEQSAREILPYRHIENRFSDFEIETLLPHKLSTEGPFMAKGDLNNDGLMDLWIGGSAGQSGSVYVQTPDGRFRGFLPEALKADARHEDAGATWFDADGDGDLDLYVVSGGNEYGAGSDFYQDRLYLNNGMGLLTKSDNIPSLTSSGSKVLALDVDEDDDLDLLVLGRLVPHHYPRSPQTYLLINQGEQFIVDQRQTDFLASLGMISDAKVIDLENNGKPVIIAVGEWTGIHVLNIENGLLQKNDTYSFEGASKAWWNCIELADVDADGDLDLLTGNLGLNNKFHPSEAAPLHVFASDFDGNGSNDIVLAKNKGADLLPVRGRECSSQQMPFIAQKFDTYESFAKAKLSDVFSPQALKEALHLEMNLAKSGVWIKEGKNFRFEAFPVEAQMSPIKAMKCRDVNKDGFLDIVFVGNQFNTEVETVRYDAGIGGVLLGDGSGEFRFMPQNESGIFVPGDAKDLLQLQWKDGKYLWVATVNNGVVKLFEE